MSPSRDLIPGYELLGPLGKGAVGTVYRARDRAMAREVAIKIVPVSSAAKEERFRQEGVALARLDHPGIVRVHTSGVCEEGAYLVMELVEGTTLEAALDVGDWRSRAQIVVGVCQAVGHAHAQKIVHRDLKPANVLLDTQGVPRVTDFGLALVEGEERLTRTGALLGTPMSMAPEQLRGRRVELDPRIDVWALGVILYLALCGRQPFPADSLQVLAELIENPNPQRPSSFDPEISAAVEGVALRCLKKDPSERYADANEVGEALTAALGGKSSWLDGETTRAGPWATALVAVIGLSLGALAAARFAAGPAPSSSAAGVEPEAGASAAPAGARARARKALAEGEAQAAARASDELLAEQPKDAEALALRGRARLELGDFERALEDARRLDSLGEASRVADFVRGQALHGLKRNQEAARFLRNVTDDSDPSPEASLDRGLAWATLGRVAKARAELTRACAAEPVSVYALRLLGELERKGGDLDLALACYSRIAQVGEPNQALLMVAARLAFDLGDFERARATYDRVLKATPKDAAALERRAWTRLYLGDPAALDDFQRVVDLRPREPLASLALGVALGRLVRHAESLAVLTSALERGVVSYELHVNRAAALAESMDFAGAAAELQIALKLPEAQLERSRQLQRLQAKLRGLGAGPEHTGAIRDIVRALRYKANSFRDSPLARQLAKNGARCAALRRRLQAQTAALKLAPEFYECYLARGETHFALRDFSAAQADYERAQSLRHQPEGLQRLAWLFERLGRHVKALAVLRRAQALRPNDPTTLNCLATVHLEANNRTKARGSIDQALRIAPTSGELLATLGWIQQRTGYPHQARMTLDRSIDLAPSFPLSWGYRARLRYEGGDKVGAWKDLEQALKLNPAQGVAHQVRGHLNRDAGDMQGAIADYERALLVLSREGRAHQEVEAALEELRSR